MKNRRKPTQRELNLIGYLINKAQINLPEDWKKCLKVLPMEDGGMGSLQLFLPTTNPSEHFGRQVSDCSFQDVDGVKVIASLNVDSEGNLSELDIWKTDFSPLRQIPERVDSFKNV